MRSPVSQSSGYCLTIRKASQSLALAILLVAGSSGGLVPTLTAIASLPSTPASASDLTVAQDFSPPDDWSGSGQREGGSTRGGLVIQGTSVVALIPASNLGTTLSPQPTLFFYIPIEAAGLEAELVVLNEQEDVMYQAIAPLPSQQGIVSMDLPPSANLEAGRRYQWYFSIIVSPDDPSSNLVLNGWVQRQPVEPTLTQQINATPPEERPALYRQFGIWYEALGSLAELRRANPEDAGLQAQWAALLESVGLGAIADQPLLGDLSVAVSGRSPLAPIPTPPSPTLPVPSPAIPTFPTPQPTASPTLQANEPSPLTEPSPPTLPVRGPAETLQSPEGSRRITGFYNPPDPDFYNPPDQRVPNGRLEFRILSPRVSSTGMGGFVRRGDAVPESFQIIAIIPQIPAWMGFNHNPRFGNIGLGITLSNTPVFFIYCSSEAAGLEGEFTLWSEEQGELLYVADVTLLEQGGVFGIALPPSVILEPGQTYYWTFEVLFDEEDRSRNPLAEGLVQLRAVDPALAQRIAATPPLEKPAFYADLGIWYDALSSLVELRWAEPDNQDLQEQWVILLEAVGLGDIADQPLIPPPNFPASPRDNSSSYAAPSLPAASPEATTTPGTQVPREGAAGDFYNPPDARISPTGPEGGGSR